MFQNFWLVVYVFTLIFDYLWLLCSSTPLHKLLALRRKWTSCHGSVEMILEMVTETPATELLLLPLLWIVWKKIFPLIISTVLQECINGHSRKNKNYSKALINERLKCWLRHYYFCFCFLFQLWWHILDNLKITEFLYTLRGWCHFQCVFLSAHNQIFIPVNRCFQIS